MANKTVYTLDLDTSKLISKYKDAISEMEKAGVSTDVTKGLSKSLEKLSKEYESLSTAGKAGFTNSKQIESFQKRVEKLMASFRGFETELGDVGDRINSVAKKSTEAGKKLQNAFGKLGFKDSAKAMDEVVKATDREAKLSEIVEAELKSRAEAVKNLKAQYDAAAKAAEEASAKAAGNSLSSQAGAKINGKNVWTSGQHKPDKSQREAIAAQAEAIAKSAKSGQEAWQQFTDYLKVNSLDKVFNSRALPGVEEAIKNMQQGYAEAAPAIEAATQAQERLNEAEQSFSQIGKRNKDGTIVPLKNATRELSNELRNYEQSQTDIASVMEDGSASAQDMARAEQEATNAANKAAGAALQEENAFQRDAQAKIEAADATEKTARSFEQLKDRMLMFFSVTSIFQSIRNEIRKTYEDVKQLDKSFASIAMVTNYSVNEMWQSYGKYADMAGQLGQKTNDVIQASALFYQQGLDTEDALELTTDTMKLATLAGNDFQTATQEMTSALRGFKMEMDEGGHVTDVYSELAAHAAAKVDDIAQAMARTASIANSAGMSFENTSAFLTQMIETTQESAENIGTSLKTIIARFTELKENVAGTADSEFEDLDYNKVDKALKSVGVSLKDTNGQFRDLDQVFLELSQKWDTLDRNTQRYVATIAAGSRQQSRFIAMMDNYDRTVELMDLAANAEGKADEQFAKYADTMEYKLNQLNTKWEEFRVQLLDSDVFKGVIDGLTNVVDRLKNVNLKTAIPVIPFAIWAARTFITNFIKTAQTAAAAASAVGKAMGRAITKGLSQLPFVPKFNEKMAQQKLKILMDRLKKTKEQYGDLTYDVIVKMDTEKILQGESAINNFKNTLMKMGASEEEANMRLKEFAVSEGIISDTSESLTPHLTEVQNALLRTAQSTQKADSEFNRLNTDMNKIKARSKMVGEVLQGVGTAAAASLSGWASGMMTWDEALDNFLTMMISWCASLVVQWAAAAVINRTGGEAAGAAAGTGINAGLASTGVGIIIVAILGAVALIFKLIRKNKSEVESAADRAKALEEGLKEANKQGDMIKDNAKSSKEQYDETKSLKEEYEELTDKVHKTKEEEERYAEIIKEIEEKYPEIILYHDEINNKLKLNNSLWEQILEKQKASMETNEKMARTQTVMDINSQYAAQRHAITDKDEASRDKRGQLDDLSYGIKSASYTVKSVDFQWDSTESFESIIQNGLNTSDYSVSLGDLLSKEFKSLEGDVFTRFRADENIALMKEAVEATSGNQELIDKLDKWSTMNGTNQTELDERDHGLTFNELYEVNNALEKYSSTLSLSTELEDERLALLKEQNEQLSLNYAAQYKKDHTGASESEALLYGATMVSSQPIDQLVGLSDVIELIHDQTSGKKGTITLGGKDEESFSDLLNKQGTDEFEQTLMINGKEITLNKQEIYDRFLAMYNGDVEAAESAWKSASEEGRAARIFYEEYTNQMQKQGEESWKLMQEKLGKDSTAQQMLQKIIDDGSQAADIAAFKDYMEQYYKDIDVDGILKQFEEKRQNFEDALKQYKFTIDLSKVDADIGNSMIQHIDEQIGQGVSADSLRKTYEAALKGLSTAAQEDMIHMLNTVDFSDITLGNLEKQKAQWIQEFRAMKEERGEIISSEEAEREWNKFFAIGEEHGAIDVSIRNIEGLQEIEDTMTDFVSGIAESADKVASTLSDYSENGYINLSQYKELAEELDKIGLSVEDYTQATEEGFSVNVDELEQAYLKQINDKDYLIKQAQEAIKQGIEELNNEISVLEALDGQRSANNDLIKQEIQKNNLTAKTAHNALVAAGYFDEAKQVLKDGTSNIGQDKIYETSAALTDLKKRRDELQGILDDEEKLAEYIGSDKIHAGYREVQRSFNGIKGAATDSKKALEDLTKAQEDLAKAEEDLIDKQDDLNEKLKEYNELLYGSPNRKTTLDLLYNYEEAINSFNDEITRSKDLLSDSKSVEESTNALLRYTQATHNLLAEEKAKQQIYQKGLANYADTIENGGVSYTDRETGNNIDVKFGDYVKKDARTGKYMIDQRLINEAQFADKWKDYLEEQVSNYNKYSEDLLKSEDNVRKAEKELQDERDAARQKYVKMEQEIADALKQQYQDEVDELKNKYDSMKDADDDYLDALQEAIDKQRQLREQDQAWEDLAQKEKKLSLMQRDTSGANALEVQNLEQDVEKTREQMLDDAIDNVIDGLSKLYESQQELRDEEMELKEALLDNTLYWNSQAESLAGSFESADEYAAYLSSISKEYANMTLAMQQDKLREYGETYEAATEYMSIISMDKSSETGDFIVETMTVTGEEVDQIITSTAEVFSDEVIRSYNETTQAFTEDMKKAEEAIDDANKALQEAIQKYNECAAAAKAAADAYEQSVNVQNTYQDWEDTYESEPEPSTLYGLVNSYGVRHEALDDISHKMEGAEADKAMIGQIPTLSSDRVEELADQSDFSKEEIIENWLTYHRNQAAAYASKAGINGYAISDAGKKLSETDFIHWVATQLADKKFAEGGLVNFTGPAWVDGSPERPEAFLSAEDTENIGNAARILSNIPWIDRTTDSSTVVTNNGGDVNVEINLNIDHISSETDIDEMLERVKEEIVEVARPAGTNTILQQEL